MKRIKILGSGCAKCKQLADVVKSVVADCGIEAMIEKVEDMQQIIAFNVMSTPALVIDEKVVSSGKLLSYNDVKELLCAPSACCCGGAKSSGTQTGCC